MGATQDIITRLDSYGKQSGEFIQSTRGGRHLAPGQVDEGFCQGVCIDWTRRVLQDGRVAYSERRSSSQTLRQATIQIRIEDLRTQHNESVGLYNALIGVYNGQLPAYNHDRSQDEVTLTPDIESRLQNYFETFVPVPNHRYKMSRIKNLYESLDQETSLQRHTTEPGWSAFAHNMDNYHQRKRTEARERDSKRPFTHIRIVESEDRRHHGNGTIRAALNHLLQMDNFVPRTVLLLGFGLDVNGDRTGHAVAVFRRENQEYFLLDPNYGVFRYTSLESVFTALLYLFGDLDPDTQPVYGSQQGWQVTGAVSYILFAHA
jgi:hypothetical protein